MNLKKRILFSNIIVMHYRLPAVLTQIARVTIYGTTVKSLSCIQDDLDQERMM